MAMRTVILVALALCVAAPVAAQDPRPAPDTLFRLSMVAAVAAHGADLATTEHCLGGGGCVEMNPALRLYTTQPAVFGAVKMGVAALSLWATAKLHETHPKWATAINFAVAGAFSGIAVHNARVEGAR